MVLPASRRNGRARKAHITYIVQSLRRVFKAIQTYSRQAWKEFGVTGPQLWLLRTLEDAPSLTVGDLAERMCLHISTVSGVLDRLEERDYVRRERDADDHRIIHVCLTRRGRGLLRGAPEPAQGKLLHGLDRLPPADLARLHQSVETLVRIMEARNVKATFFFEDADDA